MQYSYNPKYDSFCFQNCMNYALFKHNVLHADLYINKSLSLLVRKDPGCNLEYHFDENCLDLVPSYSNKIQTFMSDDDPVKVLERIAATKEKDHELILGVDSFELPYLPFYRKSHGLHSVVLNSVDFQNNTINISDCMDPWYFEGNVDLTDFINARASNNVDDGGMFSGIQVKNIWKDLNVSGIESGAEQLIKEQITLTLSQYYCATDAEDTAKGINSIKYMLDKLRMFFDFDDSEREILLSSIHKILFRYNRRRIFWTSLLDSIPTEMKTQELKDYNDLFSETQNDWEKLLYSILMFRVRKKESKLKEILEFTSNTINKELQQGELLKQYASRG